jgi:hypothetical protein
VNTQHPNPDHNIWNNNGTYWCHYTVHDPNNTARRVRVSLETKDREEARKRRDDLLKNTANLSTRVPWPMVRRGQAMPDAGLDVCRSQVATGSHEYNTGKMTHKQLAHSFRQSWNKVFTA